MIALSRFRRRPTRFVAAALLALSSLMVESCIGHGCTEIGCAGQGLDLVFDGDLTESTPLLVDVELVEDGVAPASVIHCELSTTAGAEKLLCSSYLAISETGSRTLHTHEVLPMIRVTISSSTSGAVLAQRTVAPTYTHTTPTGPECDSGCTFATEHVDLPQVAQP
jgi:hypothetical protein